VVNLIYNYPAKQVVTSLFSGKIGAFEGLERPLIDYDIILVMTPMMLAGTLIGIILNIVQPSWLLAAEMILILGYTCFKSWKKAVQSWKNEKQNNPLEFKLIELDNSIEFGSNNSKFEEGNLNDLKDLMKDEMNPRKKIMQMFVLWLLIVIFNLLRGGRKSSSIIPNLRFCSNDYSYVTSLEFFVLAIFTFVFGKGVYAKSQRKINFGWTAGKGEVIWTKKRLIAYPALSLLAGIFGGMLGIGGGLILGPVFLEIGLNNSSTSATSATSVVRSSMHCI
jgi:uncharacterized membrane protein YfcA